MPLLPAARLLHVGPQHGVHPALISRTRFPEPLEDVTVHAERDGDLRFGNDENGVLPEIGWEVRQLGRGGALDLRFGRAIEAGEVSLAAAGLPGWPGGTLGAH